MQAIEFCVSLKGASEYAWAIVVWVYSPKCWTPSGKFVNKVTKIAVLPSARVVQGR